MPKPTEIEEQTKKLVLAEGKDAMSFLIQLMEKLKMNLNDTIKVMNFGGIAELPMFLSLLIKVDHFSQIDTLLIARDCEYHEKESAEQASRDINNALRKVSLIKDTDLISFRYEQFDKKIGFMLFPGKNQKGEVETKGTLEDLCLKICSDAIPKKEAQKALEDFEKERGIPFKRPHKNILHASFAFTDKWVDAKLGEALKFDAYQLDSPYLQPFIKMLEDA
jgi:hypothetical protein